MARSTVSPTTTPPRSANVRATVVTRIPSWTITSDGPSDATRWTLTPRALGWWPEGTATSMPPWRAASSPHHAAALLR